MSWGSHMSVIVNERDLLSFFCIIVIILLFIFCVQLITHGIFYIGTRFNIIRWYYVGWICVVILLIISLYIGLTLYITILALGIAMVVSNFSWRKGFLSFLLCFIFSILCLPLFSNTVHLTMSTNMPIWISLYTGQVVLWPNDVNISPEYLLILHNSVTLAHIPYKNNIIYTYTHNGENIDTNIRRFLISFGEKTRIYALESYIDIILNQKRIMHFITLLGTNSWIKNSTIRCEFMVFNSIDVNFLNLTRCLNLAFDVIFTNVRIELYTTTTNSTTGSKQLIFSHKINRANGCFDLMRQLKNLNHSEYLLTCFPKMRNYEMLKLLKDEQIIPHMLKNKIPSFVQYLWCISDIIKYIYMYINYILEYFIFPISKIIIITFLNLVHIIQIYLLYIFKFYILNYILKFKKKFKILTVGMYCSTIINDRNRSFYVRECYNLDEERWYIFGFYIVIILQNIIQWICHVFNYSIEFLKIYSWLLHIEWTFTIFYLKILKIGIMTVYMYIMNFLLYGLNFVSFFPINKGINLLLSFCSIFNYYIFFLKGLNNILLFIYTLEINLLINEIKFITYLLNIYFSFCFNKYLINFGLNNIFILFNWILYILKIYINTTFSTHIFVTCIQTIFIFIAIRNELRLITLKEYNKYPVFMRYYFGGIYTIMLTCFTKIYSVIILRYVIIHFSIIFMLLGLSILSLLSKIYNITLFIIFPYISSYVCLEFFKKNPKHRDVICLSIVKGFFVIFIDSTLGKFVTLFLHEMFILFCIILLFLGLFMIIQKKYHFRIIEIFLRLKYDTIIRERLSERAGVVDISTEEPAGVIGQER